MSQPPAAAPDVVTTLQERAALAFPPAVVEDADGWWLRYVDGGAWWASAVLPHREATAKDLSGRIARAEAFYAARGARARFQISPAGPAGLDGALAGRGCHIESPASLQTAPTALVIDRLPASALQVRVDDRPTDGWFEAWRAVLGSGGDPRGDRDMLRRVGQPSAYVSVLAAGEVIAAGRGMAGAGWAGVFGMATLPQARGRGAARQVLAALARWAACGGAHRLFLQVERDNAAALRLYERAGFSELCRYHYRTAAGSR